MVAVSAVRVSLEIWAEWRVVRPTWSVVAASQCEVASCPGGLDHNFQRVLGSSPRSALYKICANKKIGKK